MATKKTIIGLLKAANLQKYSEHFIRYGADDPKQISMLSKAHFLQLMQHVGMAPKPFHVTRLIGAIQEWYGTAPDFDMPDVPEKSKLIYHGQPEFVSVVNEEVVTSSTSKRRKVKAYHGDAELPSSRIFDDLTDDRTPEETDQLIAELSTIYRTDKPTKYQVYVNACAAELAKRDPTLLARRSKLAAKAREANARGGQFEFQRGYSTSQLAPEECTSNGNHKTNFVAANRHREKRLAEIQKLESAISSLLYEKEGLVERLKQESDRNNKTGIGVVRSKLDNIEEQVYVNKRALMKLRLSQKRSEKYYTDKLTKSMTPEEDDVIVDDEMEPRRTTPHTMIKITNTRGQLRHVTSQPPHVTSQPPHVTSQPPHVTSQPPHVTSQDVTIGLDELGVTIEGLGVIQDTFTEEGYHSQSYDTHPTQTINQDLLTDVFTHAMDANTQEDDDSGFDIQSYSHHELEQG